MANNNDEEDYWNNDGGERWVTHIDTLEAMLSTLNKALAAGAKVKPGESVLDVGCGGGVTSAEHAAAAGPSGSVVGADISEVILKVARKRYADVENLTFVTADAGTFDFEPGRFDLITSRFGVMFFADPIAAFRNMRQAGKSGGRMVFICWGAPSENPWMGAPAAAAFTVVAAPEKPEPGTPGPFSLADPERIRTIMGEAGFKDIKTTLINQKLNMGSVDSSLDTMTKLGPAAEPLRQASSEQRVAAIQAMRSVLEANDTAKGVMMQGTIWLVEASIP